MKDSDIKSIVLKQIMSAMNDDSAKGLTVRIEKKKEKKTGKPFRLSALSDIRNMLE